MARGPRAAILTSEGSSPMRRFVSALAALVVLGASATSAFAEQVNVVSEDGRPVSLARVGMRYRSVLGPSNRDSVRLAENGTRVEIYKFQAERGQCLDVTMRSTEFDSFVGLYQRDNRGNLVKLIEDDDGAGGLDARLRGTVAAAGPYYVVVAEAKGADSAGQYTLEIAACPTIAPSPGTRR